MSKLSSLSSAFLRYIKEGACVACRGYLHLLLTLLGITILVFLTHTPWIGKLSSHFIGGSQGDGGLYVWLTVSFQYDPLAALYGESSALYPYPLTRAWSDSFLIPAAISKALLAWGAPLALAYNITFIAAIILNGLGVWALCRILSLAAIPSFCAAASFACSSYLTGNFGHPQLQLFFWVPLCWACVLDPEKSSLRRWFLAGICVAASFYCAVYYAIFASLGLALILLLSLRPLNLTSARLALLRGVVLGIGALPIAWILPAYLRVKDTFGSRGLYEADAFAASGVSYISFSNFNWLLGHTSSWTHAEATLGAGITALCIALIYLIKESLLRSVTKSWCLFPAMALLLVASSIVDAGITSEILIALGAWIVLLALYLLYITRPSSPASIMCVLVGVFFVLSFGPGGNPVKGEPALAPFSALYSLLPGMDSVRAVSRFGSVVIMGVYIAAASALCSLFSGSPAIRAGLSLAMLSITVVENYTRIFPLEPLAARPAAFDALQHKALPNEAAIVLPFTGTLERGRIESWTEFATLNTRYAIWSSPLGIPFVNGYSGQRSKLMTELPAALRSFPSSESIDWLSRICGLRWIIVVPALFSAWDQAGFERSLAEQSGYISLVSTASDGSMLLRIEPWTSTTAPIFAPTKMRVVLEFQQPTLANCSVTTHELLRNERNQVVSVQGIKTLLDRNSTRLELPANLPRGAQPHLFKVETQPCSTPFRCSIHHLNGLK